MGLKIQTAVDVYEIDGLDVAGKKVIVLSHWNDNRRVVLAIGDTKYTVIADDLERAIRNATNHRG